MYCAKHFNGTLHEIMTDESSMDVLSYYSLIVLVHFSLLTKLPFPLFLLLLKKKERKENVLHVEQIQMNYILF